MSEVTVQMQTLAENDGFTTVTSRARKESSSYRSNRSNPTSTPRNKSHGTGNKYPHSNDTHRNRDSRQNNGHSNSYRKPTTHRKKSMDLAIKEMFTKFPNIASLDEATSIVCDDLSNNEWNSENIRIEKSHIEMGITCRATSYYNVAVMKEGLNKMKALGNKTNWDKKKMFSIYHPLLFPRTDIVELNMETTILMINICMNSAVGSTILTVNSKNERPLSALFISDAYSPDQKQLLYQTMTNIPESLAVSIFNQSCNKLTCSNSDVQAPLFAWAVISNPLACIKQFLKNIQSMKKMPLIINPHSSIRLIMSMMFKVLTEDIDGTEYMLNEYFASQSERRTEILNNFIEMFSNEIQQETTKISAQYTQDKEKVDMTQEYYREEIDSIDMLHFETMHMIGSVMGEFSHYDNNRGINATIKFLANSLSTIPTDIVAYQCIRALVQSVNNIIYVEVDQNKKPIKAKETSETKKEDVKYEIAYEINQTILKIYEDSDIITTFVAMTKLKKDLIAKVRFNVEDVLINVYGGNKDYVKQLIAGNDACTETFANNISDPMPESSVSSSHSDAFDLSSNMSSCVINRKTMTENDIESSIDEIIYEFELFVNKDPSGNLQNNIKKGFPEFMFTLCEYGCNKAIITAFGRAFIIMNEREIFSMDDVRLLVQSFLESNELVEVDNGEGNEHTPDILIDCPNAKTIINNFIRELSPRVCDVESEHDVESECDYADSDDDYADSEHDSVNGNYEVSAPSTISDEHTSHNDDFNPCAAPFQPAQPAQPIQPVELAQPIQYNQELQYSSTRASNPGPFRVAGYSQYYGITLEDSNTGEYWFWNSEHEYWVAQSMLTCEYLPTQMHPPYPTEPHPSEYKSRSVHRGKRGGKNRNNKG